MFPMVAEHESSQAQERPEAPSANGRMTEVQAAELAKLAIAGLQREFPNKPANVITGPATTGQALA